MRLKYPKISLISKYPYSRSDVCCNRFAISMAVCFCRLAHEPQMRFTLVHLREVLFEIATRGKRLSVDTETLKSGEFLFSSILVLVASCLRDLSMGKGSGRQNEVLLTLTEWWRWKDYAVWFLYEMHRAFDYNVIRKSAKNIIIPFATEKLEKHSVLLRFYHKENKFCKIRDVPCHHRSLYLYSSWSINKDSILFYRKLDFLSIRITG